MRRGGRLADIQVQQVEVGRIRLGTSTPKTARSGKTYNEPVKLKRFRLTSRSEQLILDAAQLYGGECEPWEPQSGGAQQWQVLISAPSIQVIVPPDPVSQFYEVWTGGRCQLRCDGQRELIEDRPCVCGPDPARRKCKPTTRLSLMLAGMRGVGIWRLETHGYYAAAELPAVADLLSAAGGNVPARLEMEERSATVPDPRDPNKEVVTRFMVPVLHVEATPAALIATFGSQAAIGAPPVREAVAAGSNPPPAAIAPTAELDESPEQREAKMQWTIMAGWQDQIVAAADKTTMVAIRNSIQADDRLAPQFRTELQVAWNARAKALAGNPQTQAPPPPPPAPTTPPPSPPPAMDKQTAWLAVQTWGGYNNLKLSDLRSRYATWSGGKTIQESTAQTLQEFLAWLQAAYSQATHAG